MSDVTPVTTVKVEIDGKSYDVPKDAKLIEVTDSLGIHVPRFCYHKKLSIAANCRMCLVEVEGARRPAAACATPVMDGMKVHTKSKTTRDYQKSVMEFLLINHPLDCPICDQGGECELQDQALGYGKDVSRYSQGKRTVPHKEIGSLVETDLTRCIQCTRCVRFGEEIVGRQQLGLMCRGEHEEITLYLENELDNELSGNVIDLCPVGALTNKPFRYQARPWEMRQHPMVSPHDAIGSSLYGHVRNGKLMRVVPRENEAINEAWISDRDRYGMFGLNAEDRLTTPMIKRNGDWESVSWERAIEVVTARLGKLKDTEGPQSIGGIASPNSTTEALYLFQKLLRSLGTNNIDHRLQQLDFNHQDHIGTHIGLDCEMAEIAGADRILLVGSNTRSEAPILNLKIRQAALKGAEVSVINPMDCQLQFDIAHQSLTCLHDMVIRLASLTKAVLTQSASGKAMLKQAGSFFDDVKISEEIQSMADSLCAGKQVVMIAGHVAQSHPSAAIIHALMVMLRQALNAKGGALPLGANAVGARLAGVLPHQGPAGKKDKAMGMHIKAMLSGSAGLKGYLLLNTEVEFDSVYGQGALDKLRNAECVVALTPFAGESLKEVADVLLPVATFAEMAGSYVNASGHWQAFTAATPAPGEAKPAWKVLRVLGNFFECEGFDYDNSTMVLAELRQLCEQQKAEPSTWGLPEKMPAHNDALVTRIGSQAVYGTDMLVRRSAPLQATALTSRARCVTMHSALAQKLSVEAGQQVIAKQAQGGKATLTVRIDDSLAKHNVILPVGTPEAQALGVAFGAIELVKA